MTTIFNWFARLKVFQKEEPKRIFRHKKNQKEYGKIHDKELQNLEHFSFTFLFCSSFSSSVFTELTFWAAAIRIHPTLIEFLGWGIGPQQGI